MGVARSLLRLFLCGLLSAIGLSLLAQDATYRLQVEDVIRIQVYDEPQIDAILPVGRDGNISAPFIGIIRAAGKTTSELEAELTVEYQRKLKLRDPKVAVTIQRFRTIRASVGGFVKRPGVFEVRPGDTLVTLLNMGGGPIEDRADLRRATFRRANSQELIPVDLYAMLILGDTSQNYVLEDGDELTVPEETKNRILVLGAVMAPGAYPYKEPMTLIDAISLARGEVRFRSMFSKIMVVRELPGRKGQYLRIHADLVKFVRNGDSKQNVTLLPGDLVYVPETKTPDFNQIASIASTLFYFDRFFRDNAFGLRLLP